ncbi:MAG TPA: hypothetical protein VFG69_12425 [Nannocystaceae bacterium]|nr:hypothetical protein [Nannocystaceae bacterium]
MIRVVALALVVAACSPDSGDGSDEAADDQLDDGDASSSGGMRDPAALVDPFTWTADVAIDPMPSHRPADAVCDVGFGEEFGVFEIDTQICNYGVFSQPTLAEVRVGDTVELTITHDDLVSDEPAIGHIMVGLGDAHMFEAEVEIPGPYGLVTAEWEADADVPVGTPVALHLHNHGFNQWRLVAIVTRPPM